MAICVKDLLAAAREAVPSISADEAMKCMAEGDVLVIDVRDAHEVAASGKLKGAINVSRGMIEFRADPDVPYHDPEFRKDRRIIVYCASGGRSALAGKVLKDMGYGDVRNLGAFKDAAEAGVATEPA